MARHFLSDARMQAVRAAVIDRYICFGSVNNLADALTSALGGSGKVYPARLHAVLSDDPTKSLNTGSLESLERAIRDLEAGEPDPELLSKIRAEASLQPQPLDSRGVEVVAERTGVPPCVVRAVTGVVATPQVPAPKSVGSNLEPDWSWQEDAVRASLKLMAEGHKVGLFVPTGGGKTRMALTTALRFLADNPGKQVVWVTHRSHLKEAARRELQQLVDLSADDWTRFDKNIRFEMVNSAAGVLDELGDRLGAFIIDEAHHGAAPSYQAVLDRESPALLLTATPNRMDGQAIGITAVGYVITYRRLFDSGCVLEPIFEEPLPVMKLSDSTDARRLAQYLLEYVEQDVNKMLVAVSRAEYAEKLHELLIDELAGRNDHPLGLADIGFVHGQASSTGDTPQDFLDDFSTRPRAIMVATQQLIGEGFSDRSIDGVTITYPSNSISNLMQVAGRALRYSPGKKQPRIIQVRQSSMEYHFEQRWLYQDISDRLRPRLADRQFSTVSELKADLTEQLSAHNVPADRIEEVLGRVDSYGEMPGRIRVLLSGLHHTGAKESFAADAPWTAFLVDESSETDFLRVFNDISERNEEIVDLATYLQSMGITEPADQARFAQIIRSMDHARLEIRGEKYEWHDRRDYTPGLSTSWLTYLTFEFRQANSAELVAFLRDCVNRDEVLALVADDPDAVAAVAKLPLPLRSFVAYPLTEEADEELGQHLEGLRRMLEKTQSSDQWASLRSHIDGSVASRVPLDLMWRIGELTPDSAEGLILRLKPANTPVS